jgi:hypothetical protein
LNVENKLCDRDGNKLVFATGEVDTSASDGSYLDPNADTNVDVDVDVDADAELDIELEKWIINAIKL